MKNNLLNIILIFICHYTNAQSGGGVEHYYYISRQQVPAMVPMVHYSTKNNWYGEARYNYEDYRTMSLYGGKTFSKEGKWNYSATPMIGGMIGTMNGGSLGLNVDMSKGKLFLSSQSQYSFSMEDKMNKYFFTWSEMGYSPLNWLYAGVAVQQTSMIKESGLWEPGCMIGLTFNNWTIPLYIFNAQKQERFYVLGINWEWQNKSGSTNKNNLPVLSRAAKN